MTVGRFCTRDVVFAHKDTPVTEAARLMREYHVGDLVVVNGLEGERVPVGIVTDRDIVVEVVCQRVDADQLRVGDIMNEEVVTANDQDDLVDTVKQMRAKGIRRIPVVDKQNALTGILSVDDLIELYAEQITDLAKLIVREQERERKSRK